MRLDKFLKVSRLVRRRTVASELCKKDRVSVNGRPAKPGHQVDIGDELQIELGSRRICVRILDLKGSASSSEASSMYEVLSEGSA